MSQRQKFQSRANRRGQPARHERRGKSAAQRFLLPAVVCSLCFTLWGCAPSEEEAASLTGVICTMDGRRLTLDTSAPQDYLGYQSLDVVIENSTLLKDASGNPIALEWITPGDRVQVLFYGEIAGGCLTASSLQVIQEQTLAPQE